MIKSIYGDGKKDWTAEEVIELQKLIDTLNVRSLDKPIIVNDDCEEMTNLGAFIMDPRPGPDEIVEENELRETLLNYIEQLPPKELLIIKMRFGFDGNEPKTLDEIGNYFGVTRERIRQVECKALNKLKWNIMVKDKHRSINDF